MRNTLFLGFVIAAIAISGICLYQGRQLQQHKAEVARLEEQAREQASQLQAARTSHERLKQQRVDLAEKLEATSTALETAEKRATVVASNAVAAKGGANTAEGGKGIEGFGGTIAKMLANPEMKKMIVQQQRAMMDTMYGPLFKELGLSKAETDQFKELLLTVQMKAVDQSGALFGGKPDGESKAEIAKALGEATKQSEDDIRAFLGEDRYNQYKDYKETLAERMQLNLLTQQLGNGQNPLTSEQQNQLLSIMTQERKTLATDFANVGWSGGKPADPSTVLSEEKMSQIMDLQQNLSQRVYDRAKMVLQPEQLDAFGTFQTNQLSMQRLGIKMLQGMMSPGQNSESAAKPSP